MIAWKLWHSNTSRHLHLEPIAPAASLAATSKISLSVDHQFEVSLADLVADIKGATFDPNGYLATLETDAGLQVKFDKAVSEIFDPTI